MKRTLDTHIYIPVHPGLEYIVWEYFGKDQLLGKRHFGVTDQPDRVPTGADSGALGRMEGRAGEGKVR